MLATCRNGQCVGKSSFARFVCVHHAAKINCGRHHGDYVRNVDQYCAQFTTDHIVSLARDRITDELSSLQQDNSDPNDPHGDLYVA